MNFSKNSEVTVKLTEDHEPTYVYFIDGVYFQQKGFDTVDEARREGEKELKGLLSHKK